MKYIFIPIVLFALNACVVSNTSLNDGAKAKNSKLVSVSQPANLLRTKFLESENSIRIYGTFLANDSLDADTFKAKYMGSYGYILDYTSKDRIELRNIIFNLDAISTQNRIVNFYFDIPKPKTDLIQFWVKIELSERGSSLKMQTELAIRLNSMRTADVFGLYKKGSEQILLNSYVNFQDSIVIKSLDEKVHKFTLVRYNHDFDAALSPLAVGQKPTPKPLFVDSLYEMSTNTPFVLGQPGLYYFIKDTSDRTGFSVLGVDNRFPKYTRPNQLSKPLVYLTTSQEYLNLNSTADYKKNLDQFWLSLYSGNQLAAKKTIKSLYRKVEEANILFSGYKEGWKTDKGMVFIVMGRPDNIRLLKDKEVWVYTKNAKFSEINFTFTKRPNQFIEDHFELSRFSEFQPIWFPAVELWRAGENL